MSSDEIEASYIWTREEFLSASLIHDPVMNSLIVRFGGSLLAIVFISAGVVSFTVSKPDVAWVGFFPLGFGGMMLYRFSRANRRRLLKRAFAKAGALVEPDQKVIFMIDESRVRKITAGTETTWIWELIPQVDASELGYLIHASGVGHWLPYHAFGDDEDREDFAQLATRRSKLIRLRHAPVFNQSGT